MKKRVDVLCKILDFGNKEQKELIALGKDHEAYQIEHARKVLILRFDSGTIAGLLTDIEKMTEYTIDTNGNWNYEPLAFVFDEFTRNLLVELKQELQSCGAVRKASR
ncbi:MAG: hypothetical protein IJV67_02630 [Clostridia bacterium]|nr:hypothetical protein [Clostridia bacterium]